MLTSTAAVVTMDPITKSDGLRSGSAMTPQGFASLVVSEGRDVTQRQRTTHETIVLSFLSMGQGPALDTLSATASKCTAIIKWFDGETDAPADMLGLSTRAQANSVRSTASTYKGIIGAVFCNVLSVDEAIAAGRSEAYDIARDALREAGLRPDGTTLADAEKKRNDAKLRKAAKDAGMEFSASMTAEEFAEAKAKAAEMVADADARDAFTKRMAKADKLIGELVKVINGDAEMLSLIIDKLAAAHDEKIAAPF